jgi:hypothetical protein
MGDKKKTFKYFPFSAGIQWELDKKKYVIPTLPSSSFYTSIENKKQIIMAGFGGLIETYYSLSILETFNYYSLGLEISWHGNKIYSNLINYNGIGKVIESRVDQKTLDKFPTPIFFDRLNRTYFNYLNNYRIVKSWKDNHSYHDKRPIAQQISEKSTVDWFPRFFPQIRNFEPTEEIKRDILQSKFNVNIPFVLILPDKTNLSHHSISCFNWNIQQIRAFTPMLNSVGIKILILTPFPHKYNYSNCTVFKFTLEHFLYFSKYAKLLLSKDIDYLLMFKSKILGPKINDEFSIVNNANFLDKSDLVTIYKDDLEPLTVFNMVKE